MTAVGASGDAEGRTSLAGTAPGSEVTSSALCRREGGESKGGAAQKGANARCAGYSGGAGRDPGPRARLDGLGPLGSHSNDGHALGRVDGGECESDGGAAAEEKRAEGERLAKEGKEKRYRRRAPWAHFKRRRGIETDRAPRAPKGPADGRVGAGAGGVQGGAVRQEGGHAARQTCGAEFEFITIPDSTREKDELKKRSEKSRAQRDAKKRDARARPHTHPSARLRFRLPPLLRRAQAGGAAGPLSGAAFFPGPRRLTEVEDNQVEAG